MFCRLRCRIKDFSATSSAISNFIVIESVFDLFLYFANLITPDSVISHFFLLKSIFSLYGFGLCYIGLLAYCCVVLKGKNSILYFCVSRGGVSFTNIRTLNLVSFYDTSFVFDSTGVYSIFFG